MYCIAKYPEVQKKCFDEIVNVIGTDKHRSITVADLNDLHYLENVVKESMRIFPPVPLYGRITTEETEISKLHFLLIKLRIEKLIFNFRRKAISGRLGTFVSHLFYESQSGLF